MFSFRIQYERMKFDIDVEILEKCGQTVRQTEFLYIHQTLFAWTGYKLKMI